MSLPAVVLDIEGTMSSTWFVHGTLYPYSQERFLPWIIKHAEEPRVIAQLEAVRTLSGELDANHERIVWWLNHWLKDDQKVTPLKAFQGWIWGEGFAAGDLTSHFYDDAIPAMRRWFEQGKTLFIFSSGSVSAQLAWFGNTPEGDILSMFSGHYDTENIGPKRVASSYETIANTIGFASEDIVFLSDLADELDSAREAGWKTVGVRREGDQYYDQGVGDHLEISTFSQLNIDGAEPVVTPINS